MRCRVCCFAITFLSSRKCAKDKLCVYDSVLKPDLLHLSVVNQSHAAVSQHNVARMCVFIEFSVPKDVLGLHAPENFNRVAQVDQCLGHVIRSMAIDPAKLMLLLKSISSTKERSTGH
jgi:hypothetical protein